MEERRDPRCEAKGWVVSRSEGSEAWNNQCHSLEQLVPDLCTSMMLAVVAQLRSSVHLRREVQKTLLPTKFQTERARAKSDATKRGRY